MHLRHRLACSCKSPHGCRFREMQTPGKGNAPLATALDHSRRGTLLAVGHRPVFDQLWQARLVYFAIQLDSWRIHHHFLHHSKGPFWHHWRDATRPYPRCCTRNNTQKSTRQSRLHMSALQCTSNPTERQWWRMGAQQRANGLAAQGMKANGVGLLAQQYPRYKAIPCGAESPRRSHAVNFPSHASM